MVFIDEKGRIFEKINIIDFVVFILMICGLIAIIAFSGTETKTELNTYRMNLRIINPECSMDNLKENDVEIYDGEIRAILEKIKIQEPYEMPENKTKGENAKKIDKNIILQMLVWLKQQDNKIIYTNNQKVKENEKIILNLNNTVVIGQIMDYKKLQ